LPNPTLSFSAPQHYKPLAITPQTSRNSRNDRKSSARRRISRNDSAFPALPGKRGLVARATVDTTLAVIPAEAFTRLTKKFPKASAHIVQGKQTN
jgi:hypothetical protein